MKTRYTLHFDSRDRDRFDETSPSSYTLLMPKILRRVVSARLLSAEIPTSWYTFASVYGNTSMRVTLSTGVGDITQTVTIPDGEYTVSTIPSVLKSSLESAFPSYTFDCSVSPTTMTLRIAEGSGTVIRIHTEDANDDIEYRQTLPHFLGFSYNTLSSGAPLVATHIINLHPATYLLLDINELNRDHEGGLYGSRISPRGVFAKVPVDKTSFAYAFWQPRHPVDVHMNPPIARLDRLTVHWRFHTLVPVDFDTMEHSFTIEFTVEDDHPEETSDIVAPEPVQSRVVIPHVSQVVPEVIPQTSDSGHISPVAVAVAVAAAGVGLYFVTRRNT